MKTLTPTEAAYIAGIIDGEGSISASFVKRTDRHSMFFQCGIYVSMTDLALVEWLRETTDVGFISHRKTYRANHKAQRAWTVKTQQAAELLMQLLPYMHTKREQAERCIELCESLRKTPVGGNRRGLRPVEFEHRVALCNEIRRLNGGKPVEVPDASVA